MHARRTILELDLLNAAPDELAALVLQRRLAANDRVQGLPLLHVATLKRSPELVELLLGLGADPRARTAHGCDAPTLALQLSLNLLPSSDFEAEAEEQDKASEICVRLFLALEHSSSCSKS